MKQKDKYNIDNSREDEGDNRGNDPAFPYTRDMIKLMIADYRKNAFTNKDLKGSISGNMKDDVFYAEAEKDLSEIKKELEGSDFYKTSADWVEEWNEKKEKGTDKQIGEIREFVQGSLGPAEDIPKTASPTAGRKSESGKRRILSYISLAAAVIIGTLFIIRTLLPFNNTDKLFSRYYEPYPAVSDVTRGTFSAVDRILPSALESYKNGNYQAAVAGFTAAMVNDPLSNSPRFFLGITHIALNNYGEAVELLEDVAEKKTEYAKEAAWYLGLACLKTGDKNKAAECFELLARSPGFYSEPSEKLLRRLR
jgi:hypothetical protein